MQEIKFDKAKDTLRIDPNVFKGATLTITFSQMGNPESAKALARILTELKAAGLTSHAEETPFGMKITVDW